MVDLPLTIAVPAYRRAHAIEPLLRTLVEQSGPQDDLVVIDDASGDNIVDVVAAVGRFRLIQNERNLGMVGNWNACLHAARQEWVCIVHHDDEVVPGGLAALRRACVLADGPAIVTHQRLDAAVDSGFRYRWCEPGPWAVLNVPTIPSGTAVHRQIVETAGVFDPRWTYSSDLEYFARVCARFPLLVIESPGVVRYRLHKTNHQYDTWRKPDFLAQLEALQRTILGYAQIPEHRADELLARRMAAMYEHMFFQAARLRDRKLVRRLGRRLAAGHLNHRKLRLQAGVGAVLGWYPDRRTNHLADVGIDVEE